MLNSLSLPRDVSVSYATEKDLSEVVALEQKVAASLPSRHMLVLDDEAFFKNILDEQGVVVLAKQKGVLVAAVCLRFPPSSCPENLGRLCGLQNEQLGRVAHLEVGYMLPSLRGEHLVEILTQPEIERAAAQGRDIFLSTSWPCNAAGLRSLLEMGLTIRALKKLYGGLDRFVFLRDNNPLAFDDVPSRRVLSWDMPGHAALLAQGWIGVDVQRNSSKLDTLDFWVVYRKRKIEDTLA